MSDPAPVTELLQAIERHEPAAEERLLAAVYAQLHRLAGNLLGREAAACTVQATMLVHDAWLSLLGPGCADADFADRTHFFRAAARAMRNLLVDHARRRKAERRGGDAVRVTLSDVAAPSTDPDLPVLALHEALDYLESRNAALARLVELRYFAGLSIEATAQVLGRSPATLKREWTYARAFLHERLQPQTP
ncbi:MAG: RNA polymerase subunit sigma [Planctomycetes bacterium]|nr:RNA polymerase subunit sigma [Planctomycetota bacterium]